MTSISIYRELIKIRTLFDEEDKIPKAKQLLTNLINKIEEWGEQSFKIE